MITNPRHKSDSKAVRKELFSISIEYGLLKRTNLNAKLSAVQLEDHFVIFPNDKRAFKILLKIQQLLSR